MSRQTIRLSPTSAMHYAKLVYRSVLFLLAVGLYIRERTRYPFTFAAERVRYSVILTVIWGVYAAEMLLRFFPAALESPAARRSSAGIISPCRTPGRTGNGWTGGWAG